MSRMAKGKEEAINGTNAGAVNANDFPPESSDMGFDSIESDFDTDQEYKPAPLIPNGKYKGAVTEVKFNGKDQTIDWTVTLNNNGGLMNDATTPIDGNQLPFRNWLPLKGDENKPTKKGNMSTRQAKINMLTRFSSDMKIDMSKPAIIIEAINTMKWVGIEVNVDVEIREWEGQFFNGIKNMKAA